MSLSPPVSIDGNDAAPSAPPAAGDENKPWGKVIAIAVLFLVGIGGGFWFLHRGVGNAPSDAGPLTNVMADSPPGLYRGMWRGGPRPGGNRNNPLRQLAGRLVAAMPDGVSPAGAGYVVRAGTAHMDVTPGNNGKFNYRFSYAGETLVTPEEAGDLMAGNRARDPEKAKAAGVTADQLDKLRKVAGGGQMVVDAADRANLEKLFAAWLDAAGRKVATSQPLATPIPAAAKPAETTLVSALSALGKKQLAPTKQALSERAKQYHAILSDAELAKLK